MKFHPVIRKTLSCATILLIFGYMLKTLLAQWDRMGGNFVRFDLPLLGLSCFPVLFNQGLAALIWKDALSKSGPEIRWQAAYRIISLSQLARYVPGSIWGALSLVHLASARGISAGRSVEAFFLLNAIMFLSAGFVAFGFLLGWKTGLDINPLLLLPGIALLFTAIHPRMMNWWRGLLFRLLRRESPSIPIDFRLTVRLMAISALYWALSALGIYLLTLAIIPSYSGGPFFLLGAMAVSWVSGYIAFFTPGGLGVREGVMATILAQVLPGPAAVLIALAVRGRLILCEALAAGIAAFMDRPDHVRQHRNSRAR
mgnify:CR=1 FL=1